MGLDCSHNAWHGAYSAFMTWRRKLAEIAGLPPLDLMEGFYPSLSVYKIPEFIEENLPIKWDCLKPSPLHELLYHSDCDGYIPSENCNAIADELEKLLPLLPEEDHFGHIGNWRQKTETFIQGLRKAAESGEDLHFH